MWSFLVSGNLCRETARALSTFAAVIKACSEVGTGGPRCLIANGMNGIEAQIGKHPLSEAGRVPRVPSQLGLYRKARTQKQSKQTTSLSPRKWTETGIMPTLATLYLWWQTAKPPGNTDSGVLFLDACEWNRSLQRPDNVLEHPVLGPE